MDFIVKKSKEKNMENPWLVVSYFIANNLLAYYSFLYLWQHIFNYKKRQYIKYAANMIIFTLAFDPHFY